MRKFKNDQATRAIHAARMRAYREKKKKSKNILDKISAIFNGW